MALSKLGIIRHSTEGEWLVMPDNEPSPADVIASYRRRRGRTVPLVLGGSSVILLVLGLSLIILWITGDNPPTVPSFLSTDTPIPTVTATTIPPSQTPTITLTPTVTMTGTASEPFGYIVQEGDTLFSIAEQFTVDVEVLLAYNIDSIDDAGTIFVGQEITVPPPDAELPTPTPLPDTLLPGQEIEYRVQAGDSLQSIAAQFNSTAEAIAEVNEIEDVNAIRIGDLLIIPVNIATPTPTQPA